MCEVRNGNKKETKQKSSPEMCKREALEFLLNSRNMNGSRLAIRALKKKTNLIMICQEMMDTIDKALFLSN